MSLNRPLLVRAASSATVTMLALSALLLSLIFRDGWSTTRLFNAVVVVSGLWVVGWPFTTALWAAKRIGATWGKALVSDEPATTSAVAPPSGTLAKVGVSLFALSILTLAGIAARSIAHVIRDLPPTVGGEVQAQDPREPPELPASFPAAAGRDALLAELELDEMWSTTHPEYDGEIRILITSAPVEGLSPNYSAAFYHRNGDAYVRIGRGFGFGGYHPPELGRHPTLDLPAIVCEMEAIPERTYFFVHEGVNLTFHENEKTWSPVDEMR